MRILLRRILIALFSLVLALLLFLVGSVVVDAVIGGGRIQALTNTQIENPNGPSVGAFVAQPQDPGKRPAVIMIHEFWGMKAEVNGKAAALAEQGYVVVAPDTYRGQATGWIPRAIYLALTIPTERVNADLDAVFAWLAQQPNVDADKIVVMGFCYGGGKALQYSLHNNRLAGTGIFYGQLIDDPELAKRLPSPVLGIFGEQDQAPSPQDVAAFQTALKTAGIEHEITIYPGVGHAFVKSVEEIRRDPTQGAAWEELLSFLKRVTSS